MFTGGLPQTGSRVGRGRRGVCRAWGGVSDSEKFFGKFPRVIETFGIKEKLWRHLAENLVVRFSPNLGDLKGTLGRINEPKISEIVRPGFV